MESVVVVETEQRVNYTPKKATVQVEKTISPIKIRVAQRKTNV